ILEQHGIVGNATLERNAAATAPASSTSSTTDSAGLDIQDDGLPAPFGPTTATAQPEPSVVGLILRFASPDLAARAAANEAPPDELLDTLSAASWIALDYQRPMSMGGFVFNF